MTRTWTVYVLLLTLFLFVGKASAQVEKDSVAAAFAAGDFDSVVLKTKLSNKVEDLYYLGLSYEALKKKGEAVKAFNKCFMTAYNGFRHAVVTSKAETTNRDFSGLLRRMENSNKFGYDAAKKSQELKSSFTEGKEMRILVDVLNDAIQLVGSTAEMVWRRSQEDDKGFKITRPQRPAYPKPFGYPISRANQPPGTPITVVLLVVFGADGKVKLVMPMDANIDLFTYSAIEAARGIKFTPATNNGVPVDFAATKEFSFSIG